MVFVLILQEGCVSNEVNWLNIKHSVVKKKFNSITGIALVRPPLNLSPALSGKHFQADTHTVSG
jgi:hypothetical protein